MAIDISLKPLLHSRKEFWRAHAVFIMMRLGFADMVSSNYRSFYLVTMRPQIVFAVQTMSPNLQNDLKLVVRM